MQADTFPKDTSHKPIFIAGVPPDDPQEPESGREECPHCGGLGFVVPDVAPDHPRFGRAEICSCRAVEHEARRMDNLARLSQLGALRECTFDAFLPTGHGLTTAMARNLRMAYDRALLFAQEPEGWLIFKGGYGCGKTHLAAAIANYQLDMGRPVLFVNVPDLLDHLRAAYSPHSAVGYDEQFDQVRNTPLLIMDDLGTQSNTEWAQEKLYQIFNYRYNARLPTVITTNEELESIEIRIRSRMVDPGLVQIVHILAPDYRRAGVSQDQSDLSTLDLHHDKRFDNFDLRERELPRPEVDGLKNALSAAHEFAQAPDGWLVFNGTDYGNGKTHLAAAIANQVTSRGEAVLFVVVPDLLDHIRETYSPAANVTYDKRFKEVKNAPLLVLDDLGTESGTKWAMEKLFQLINHRYNARLPTVITMAKPLYDINERIAARLSDARICEFILVTAPPYKGAVAPARKSGQRKRG